MIEFFNILYTIVLQNNQLVWSVTEIAFFLDIAINDFKLLSRKKPLK